MGGDWEAEDLLAVEGRIEINNASLQYRRCEINGTAMRTMLLDDIDK